MIKKHLKRIIALSLVLALHIGLIPFNFQDNTSYASGESKISEEKFFYAMGKGGVLKVYPNATKNKTKFYKINPVISGLKNLENYEVTDVEAINENKIVAYLAEIDNNCKKIKIGYFAVFEKTGDTWYGKRLRIKNLAGGNVCFSPWRDIRSITYDDSDGKGNEKIAIEVNKRLIYFYVSDIEEDPNHPSSLFIRKHFDYNHGVILGSNCFKKRTSAIAYNSHGRFYGLGYCALNRKYNEDTRVDLYSFTNNGTCFKADKILKLTEDNLWKTQPDIGHGRGLSFDIDSNKLYLAYPAGGYNKVAVYDTLDFRKLDTFNLGNQIDRVEGLTRVLKVSQKFNMNAITGDDIFDINDSKKTLTLLDGRAFGDIEIGSIVNIYLNNKVYSTRVLNDKTYKVHVLSKDLELDADRKVEAILTNRGIEHKLTRSYTVQITDKERYSHLIKTTTLLLDIKTDRTIREAKLNNIAITNVTAPNSNKVIIDDISNVNIDKIGDYIAKVKVVYNDSSFKIVDVLVKVRDSRTDAEKYPIETSIKRVKLGTDVNTIDYKTSVKIAKYTNDFTVKATTPATVDTSKVGNYSQETLVTFLGDNSVEKATIKVVVYDDRTDAEKYDTKAEDEVIFKGQAYDLTDNIVNIKDLPKGTKVVDVTTKGAININVVGEYMGKVRIEYPDGSSELVDIKVIVKDTPVPPAPKPEPKPAPKPAPAPAPAPKPVKPAKPKEPEKVIKDDNIPLARMDYENHFAYIQGYPDGTLKPAGNITRAEVAAVFFRLLEKEYRESIRSNSNEFTDVAPSSWPNKHISTLAKGRIINGYKDNTFKPRQNITRAELAVIASKFDVLDEASHNFKDVKGHWAEKYIASAAKKGWVRGYQDGTFAPNKFITRAEFVTLVNNVQGRKVRAKDILKEAKSFTDLKPSSWYYTALKAASNSYLYTKLSDSFQKWTKIIKPIIEM